MTQQTFCVQKCGEIKSLFFSFLVGNWKWKDWVLHRFCSFGEFLFFYLSRSWISLQLNREMSLPSFCCSHKFKTFVWKHITISNWFLFFILPHSILLKFLTNLMLPFLMLIRLSIWMEAMENGEKTFYDL